MCRGVLDDIITKNEINNALLEMFNKPELIMNYGKLNIAELCKQTSEILTSIYNEVYEYAKDGSYKYYPEQERTRFKEKACAAIISSLKVLIKVLSDEEKLGYVASDDDVKEFYIRLSELSSPIKFLYLILEP